MTGLLESGLEDVVLEQIGELGGASAHGGDIAPVELAAVRGAGHCRC